MRKILFRGLDKRYNKAAGHEYNVWRFGSLIEYDNGQSAIVASAERYGRGMFANEVIPETVGQYTGLKDKNGKDIFEGDIHEYDGRRFDVKFGYYTDDDTHAEMYGWYFDSNSLEEQGSLGVDSEKYVNIIGNIHDNPEPLNDSL